MRTSKKAGLCLLAVAGTILMLRHANMAMKPTLPKDMPRSAHFVQSGFDLEHNEAKGDWIACGMNSEQNTNFCRVTDAEGHIVFQGDFLPLGLYSPVPKDQLIVAPIRPEYLWVSGPAEEGPVPVIPLVNGMVLVPAADNQALADRWSNNPDELKQIEE